MFGLFGIIDAFNTGKEHFGQYLRPTCKGNYSKDFVTCCSCQKLSLPLVWYWWVLLPQTNSYLNQHRSAMRRNPSTARATGQAGCHLAQCSTRQGPRRSVATARPTLDWLIAAESLMARSWTLHTTVLSLSDLLPQSRTACVCLTGF
ncbi:hypothetical protein J6590_003313 [Homalodisca vitripennis]|nr:hypothetical protein J6590_003313 [Homalodisca vitripennis]